MFMWFKSLSLRYTKNAVTIIVSVLKYECKDAEHRHLRPMYVVQWSIKQ